MDETDEIVVDPDEYAEGVESVEELDTDEPPAHEGDDSVLKEEVGQ